MTPVIRTRAALLATLLGLAASGLAPPASAAEEMHRFAFLEATDLLAGTLHLDGEVYHATARSKFFDLAGRAVKLQDLEPVRHEGLFTDEQATVVEFEARLVRGEWQVRRLRVVPRMPE